MPGRASRLTPLASAGRDRPPGAQRRRRDRGHRHGLHGRERDEHRLRAEARPAIGPAPNTPIGCTSAYTIIVVVITVGRSAAGCAAS